MESIRILSIRKKNQRSNLCIIEFHENVPMLELHMDIIVNNGLRKDMELSPDEVNRLTDAQRLLTAKQQCYRYAAMKPRTRKQMLEYMKSKQHEPKIHETLLEFLDNFDLLDDMKFAKSYINSSITRKSVGIRKLRMELMAKGVDYQIANEAIEIYYPQNTAIEFAEKAAEKKIKSLRNKSPEKQKSSLINHLIYLGFDTNIVFKVVKKYFDKYN